MNSGWGPWRPESFLGGLSDQALAALSGQWRPERCGPGELILAEDDPGADFFVVLEGQARAAAFTSNGREVTFNDIGEGDCFGEMSAVDKQPRSSSVLAQTEVVIGRIRGSAFDALLISNPEITQALLRLATGKLRDMILKMVDYTELTAPQRIRRELLRLAKAHRTGIDTASISPVPSQTDLAACAFTRREAVNREMSRLTRRELVGRTNGALTVASIRRLEAQSLN